jgi:hypothetical protein
MLKNILLSSALVAFSSMSYAVENLKSVSFEDQWEQVHSIAEDTQWVIFSSHKDGGKWVKEIFNELKVTNLDDYKIVYVADISAMPGFITKLFAIPKMQDFPFEIYLDMEGDATVNWPRNQEQVSVYHVVDSAFEETQYFADKDTLKAFLQTVIIQ